MLDCLSFQELEIKIKLQQQYRPRHFGASVLSNSNKHHDLSRTCFMSAETEGRYILPLKIIMALLCFTEIAGFCFQYLSNESVDESAG
jgi:hypothetical protein